MEKEPFEFMTGKAELFTRGCFLVVPWKPETALACSHLYGYGMNTYFKNGCFFFFLAKLITTDLLFYFLLLLLSYSVKTIIV